MLEIKFKKPTNSEIELLANELYDDILNFYNSQGIESEDNKKSKNLNLKGEKEEKWTE